MLISIIVPVYNAEKYLSKCIGSILNQSFTNFELLLIDDGSSDNSLQILKEFERKDLRIKLFNHVNSGVSFTRNFGIKNSQGDFILFIDSDDWVEAGFIKDFTNAYAENPNELLVADLVRNGKRKAGYENKLFEIGKQSNEFIQYRNFLHNGGPCAKFFNRKILQDNQIFFHDKLTYGEDLVFLINYLRKVTHIRFLDAAKYHYEYNSNSASTKNHSFQNHYLFFKELNEFKNHLNLTDKLAEKYIYTLLWDVLESALNSFALNNSSYKSELKDLASNLDYNFYRYAKPLRKLYFILLKFNLIRLLKLCIRSIKKLMKN